MRKNKTIGKWLLLFAAICMTFTVGCSKEGTTEKKTDEEKAESTTNEDDATATSDDEDASTDIGKIVESWKKQPIEVSPKEAQANINDFAKAFCNQYNAYTPNANMLKYMDDPKKYNEEKEECIVNNDISAGYIKSFMAYQFDQFTEMCYWKRPNGHSLVGVYLREEYETSDPVSEFMFYDYDPATKTMTPDKEIMAVVEKAVKRADYDDFMIRLPQKGKDIELTLYKDTGEDSCEPTYYDLKWTDNTFKPLLIPND